MLPKNKQDSEAPSETKSMDTWYPYIRLIYINDIVLNLKMVYIPRNDHLHSQIPCVYYSENSAPLKRGKLLMLYFHGIGEDLGYGRIEISMLGRLLDMNVLAIEYPGFGLNFHRGITTRSEILKDASTVIQYLLT